MKFLIAAICLMACCKSAVKAQAFAGVSARSQSMGSIGTVLNGTWAALHNQAGLATVDRPTAAFHCENYFMVAGWGTGAIAGCLPVNEGTIGINFVFYGTGVYNEVKTALAFGRSFGEGFRAGIELDYLCIRQPSGYGNLHALVPGAGIQILPVKQFIIALHVFNPAGQHFANCSHISIPVRIRAGAALLLGDEVLICTELLKDQEGQATYAVGLEFSIDEKLEARAGIFFDGCPQPSFGLGFLTGPMHIDLSSRYHQLAGYSFAVSISLSAR